MRKLKIFVEDMSSPQVGAIFVLAALMGKDLSKVEVISCNDYMREHNIPLLSVEEQERVVREAKEGGNYLDIVN
jgi:hypothetical protein